MYVFLCLILLSVVGCGSSVPKASTDPKPPEKTETKVETDSAEDFIDKYLTLYSSQKWDQIYDSLHPDIQSMYPKEQFIADEKVSDSKYAESIKDHKIDGSVIISTWTDTKGSGKEYKNVAEVAFTENLKDGKSEKSTMHLAKASDGTWRWFCTPPKPSTQVSKKSNFAVGDTFKLDNIQYKVNSVRVSNGSEYVKPKNGNTFLLIDITVENQGSEDAPVSSIMSFKLVDKDGRSQEFSISALMEAKGKMDGTITPGRKVTGELGYEILKAAQTYELEIISNPINPKIGIVEIPIK